MLKIFLNSLTFSKSKNPERRERASHAGMASASCNLGQLTPVRGVPFGGSQTAAVLGSSAHSRSSTRLVLFKSAYEKLGSLSSTVSLSFSDNRWA